MKTRVIGLLAETSIHPGAGQDTGFVDLPVARESATDYPVIVGSSLKGALRDWARQNELQNIESIFGKQDGAGQLLIGDARLLLLPVRSLNRSYCWVTCPHLLERLERDLSRAQLPSFSNELSINSGQFLGLGDKEPQLFLEEREFQRAGGIPEKVFNNIRCLIRHESTKKHLEDRLVVLHDDDFVWFARFGLAVQARNVLDEETKISKNLWYEETIAPDSLFYSLWGERDQREGAEKALGVILKSFEKSPYLQVGANETVGQGWFSVQPLKDDFNG